MSTENAGDAAPGSCENILPPGDVEQDDFMTPMYHWVNEKLTSRNKNSPPIERIARNFADGTALISLYESITKKKFPFRYNKNPRSVFDKRKNLVRVVAVLENERIVRKGQFTVQDLLWGSLKPTYGVLRLMSFADGQQAKLKMLPHNFREAPPPRPKTPAEQSEDSEAYFTEESEEIPQEPSRYILTIDFGTEYIKYAVYSEDDRDGAVEQVMHACVTFHQNDTFVGEIPESLQYDDDAVVVTELRRVIGQTFEAPEFASYVSALPYEVAQEEDSQRPVIQIERDGEKQNFTPEELVARCYRAARDFACKKTNENVVNAVITVPGYCGESERQAVIDAAKIAGLNVVNLVGESDAGAQAAMSEKTEGVEYFVVFSMGAGNLDVNLIKQDNGAAEAKSSAGAQVGGIDFDRALAMEYGKLCAGYEKYGSLVRKLQSECERLKIELSGKDEARLSLPAFYQGKDIEAVVTREVFEKLCGRMFDKVKEVLAELFKDIDVDKSVVKRVILIGGSTKIVKIREVIREFFGDSVTLVDQETSVVKGASMRNTALTETSEKNGLVDLKLKVRHSLGVSLVGDRSSFQIHKGDEIPSVNKHVYSTVVDNQKAAQYDVVQGEDPTASKNKVLGTMTLEGIQEAPAGVPEIEVTFTLNNNGMLQVSAIDLTTKSTISASFQTQENLRPDRVEELRQKIEEEWAAEKRQVSSRRRLRGFIGRAKETKGDVSDKHREKEEQYDKILAENERWVEEHPNEPAETYDEKLSQLKQDIDKVLSDEK